MRPRERLLRRGINPNDESAIREGLEGWSDSLSTWEHVFTGAVVAGLIVEYLAEITFWFSRSVGLFLHSHDLQLREVGGLFVIIGVAGELWIGVRSGRVETDLRKESKRTIGYLRERAALAEQKAGEALAGAAEARRRQADAERELIELKLNRSPRSLLFDRLKFMGVLETSAKGTVEAMYPRGDAEAFEFAELLLTCFVVTHWTVHSHAIPIPDEDPSGVPGILTAGGRPSGIIIRGGGAIEGPFRSAVAAFRAIESRSQQYQVSAFSSGDVPEGSVRMVPIPRV
jgi:hypothetical protein